VSVLMHEKQAGRGVGVRAVNVAELFNQFAGPEVIALDERGQSHVLVGASGRRTRLTVLEDGTWLRGLAVGDIDGRIPGDELYVSSGSGRVFQIVAHNEGIVDGRFVANMDGREVHTLVAGEFDSKHEGEELLAYTEPGGAYLLTPRDDRDGFEARLLDVSLGRIRDAVLVPNPGSTVTIVACASRAGTVEIHALRDGEIERGSIHRTESGRGRIALAQGRFEGDPLVLYSTCDDGRVFRHEQIQGMNWRSEMIYRGEKGLRGLVSGDFLPGEGSPECIAIFGSSEGVKLLVQDGAAEWSAVPIFEEAGRGHWLSSAELDGTNDTEELLLASDSGRVVMLTRVPAEEF
ncbi:MAG: hypothetical protein AAF368_04070, partial [Planctomycetota bacterium]